MKGIGVTPTTPAASCSAIKLLDPIAWSGYYYLKNTCAILPSRV